MKLLPTHSNLLFAALMVLGVNTGIAKADPILQCDFVNGEADAPNNACLSRIENGSGGPNVIVDLQNEGVLSFPGEGSSYALRLKNPANHSNTPEALWSSTCDTINGIEQPCGSENIPSEIWSSIYFLDGTALPTARNGVKWWTIASTEAVGNNVIHFKVVYDDNGKEKIEFNRTGSNNSDWVTACTGLDRGKWHLVSLHMKIGATAGKSVFEIWCDRDSKTTVPQHADTVDWFLPGSTFYDDMNLKGHIMWNQRNTPHQPSQDVFWYAKGFCLATDANTCGNWLNVEFNSNAKPRDHVPPGQPIGLVVN